jgi:hypothetical protein
VCAVKCAVERMRPSALKTLSGQWTPAEASRSRAGLAVAANLVPACVAVALFVLIAPPVHWDHPELIGALAAIAAIAFMSEVRLKVAAAAYFDASIVLALLALVIAGPFAALLVWMVPDAISRLVTRQDRVLTPGLIATASSFALAALAGYGLLSVAAAPSMLAAAPALYTTGLVMYALNFLFARLTFAPFYQGYRPSVLIRTEFLYMLPPFMAMIALGVVTALLIPSLGVFALALLAAVVLLPQLALAALIRERSVTRLTCPEATQLYAAAIADVLALSEADRRVIACTAELLAEEGDAVGEPRESWRFDDVPEIVQSALHAPERWDGTGFPAGLLGSHTPLASRVLAVAQSWSTLTAKGTLELPHTEAMLALSARSATEFDPAIVDAAAQVVAEEQAFVRSPGFQPKLHRLPLPRTLRRARLPAVLAHLAGPA